MTQYNSTELSSWRTGKYQAFSADGKMAARMICRPEYRYPMEMFRNKYGCGERCKMCNGTYKQKTLGGMMMFHIRFMRMRMNYADPINSMNMREKGYRTKISQKQKQQKVSEWPEPSICYMFFHPVANI